MGNILHVAYKKYKIKSKKRKNTFLVNIKYISSLEMNTSEFSLLKILMFSTNSMKYIWYLHQKVNGKFATLRRLTLFFMTDFSLLVVKGYSFKNVEYSVNRLYLTNVRLRLEKTKHVLTQ